MNEPAGRELPALTFTVYGHQQLQGPADISLVGGLNALGTMGQNGNAWESMESKLDLVNNLALARMIDHANLNSAALVDEVVSGCRMARNFSVASACAGPAHEST